MVAKSISHKFILAILAGFLFLSGLTGCDGDFLGERASKDFLDTPVRQKEFAAYVPIQPAITDPV